MVLDVYIYLLYYLLLLVYEYSGGDSYEVITKINDKKNDLVDLYEAITDILTDSEKKKHSRTIMKYFS